MNNRESEIVEVLLDDIIPNRFQPRLDFDDKALTELSESIKLYGIIQPLVLRRIANKFEIIAGERRYKAASIAGLTRVPAIVMNIDDNRSAELAIVENIQRKDLSAIEEAQSYKKLLDRGYLTQDQLARRMGISQSSVANKLRLLTLSQEVQQALLKNQISERHARSLLSLTNNEDQIKILNKIIKERLTVKQTEEEILSLNKGTQITPKQSIKENKSDSTLENLLRKEKLTEEREEIEEIVNLDDKETFQIPINPFQKSNIDVQASPYREPVLEKPNDIYETNESHNSLIDEFRQQKGEFPIPTVLDSKSISSAINEARDVVKKLETSGFKVNSEEFDFEDMYQIIIKIKKEN
ncbi:MAG: ParB/RepB/Spo0J family partition protein [Bacilli bacterium]